ncbi:hypothetical protein P4I59_23550, partial [Escherichia coli]|nr:hypothetical protein [Escherichia coli]MDZ6443509.1 hypothetical protein [Escherichia coli]
ADRNRSHWSTSKTPSYTKSVSWQHHPILNEEKQMADWLIQHIPQTTEKFLIRSETDGVEAKK